MSARGTVPFSIGLASDSEDESEDESGEVILVAVAGDECECVERLVVFAERPGPNRRSAADAAASLGVGGVAPFVVELEGP